MFCAALAISLVAPGAPARAETALVDATATCESLAASPYDPLTPNGTGVPFELIDSVAAVMACEAAAKTEPGNPRILYQLGRALDAAGRSEEAAVLFQDANEDGFKLAAASLGYLYEAGIGVEQDVDKALALYEEAADAGVTVGLENLAYIYQNGIPGVEQDYTKAAEYHRRAAEAGSAPSAGSLGYLYENGYGVSRDDRRQSGFTA